MRRTNEQQLHEIHQLIQVASPEGDRDCETRFTCAFGLSSFLPKGFQRVTTLHASDDFR